MRTKRRGVLVVVLLLCGMGRWYLVPRGFERVAAAAPELVKVGDFVWHDVNGDGVQDRSETGIGGVMVRAWIVLEGTPVAVGTAVTDGAGHYEIGGLGTGFYELEFVAGSYPSGFEVAPANAGSDDGLDSDVVNGATGRTARFAVSGAADNLTLDLGLMGPTATALPGTPTPVPATATPVGSTATPVGPTATPVGMKVYLPTIAR